MAGFGWILGGSGNGSRRPSWRNCRIFLHPAFDCRGGGEDLARPLATGLAQFIRLLEPVIRLRFQRPVSAAQTQHLVKLSRRQITMFRLQPEPAAVTRRRAG
jgi:hypothetical protein